MRSISEPNGKRAADRSSAIVIMIVVDPERLAIAFRLYPAAKTAGWLKSVDHLVSPCTCNRNGETLFLATHRSGSARRVLRLSALSRIA
jgi:hypothetical protein